MHAALSHGVECYLLWSNQRQSMTLISLRMCFFKLIWFRYNIIKNTVIPFGYNIVCVDIYSIIIYIGKESLRYIVHSYILIAMSSTEWCSVVLQMEADILCVNNFNIHHKVEKLIELQIAAFITSIEETHQLSFYSCSLDTHGNSPGRSSTHNG